MTEEDKKILESLKEEAVELGITFSPNIGIAKLQEKIDVALGARAKAETEKKQNAKTKDGGIELNPIQLMRMKALNLRKVRISNMAQQNQGAKTVFIGVHNMYLDVARVLPLNDVIAVEQCLLDAIEKQYKQLMDEPVLDKNGNETGNYRAVEKPMYQVVYLDK